MCNNLLIHSFIITIKPSWYRQANNPVITGTYLSFTDQRVTKNENPEWFNSCISTVKKDFIMMMGRASYQLLVLIWQCARNWMASSEPYRGEGLHLVEEPAKCSKESELGVLLWSCLRLCTDCPHICRPCRNLSFPHWTQCSWKQTTEILLHRKHQRGWKQLKSLVQGQS